MADNESLPSDQQEELGDLGEAGKQYQAVINQSDWTVETIIQQIDKGNIQLSPSFQRREAWRGDRKSQYIESLILGVPVPQIVLAEQKNHRGKFIVIDGKQRLLTLRQFQSKDTTYPPFPLAGLSIRTDLNGVDYKRLSTDILYDQDFTALQNSTIRTAVIKNWGDETFLYTIFLRLNTGSVPLSPQELRQALHPGGFVSFVDDYSKDNAPLHQVMGIEKADPRMRDAELVIRYFAFRNFLQTYNGNLKPLLDVTAEHFNKIWTTHQIDIQRQRGDFELALQAAISVFGADKAFRKWNGQRFERSLNRAIYDAVMFYFDDVHTRDGAQQHSDAVVAAFKTLCTQDAFKSAIEGTTKSIEAIYTRLRLFGECLEALGIPARLPDLVGNKIVRA